MKKIWEIFKAVWAILTKPHFKSLLSNLDYLQIYNDKEDLIIILGKNQSTPNPNNANAPENLNENNPNAPNPPSPNPAMNCVLALKEIIKEGILDMSEGRYVLTFMIDVKGKQEVQKVLGK